MSVRPIDPWNSVLHTTLEHEDKEVFDIVENEKYRQWSGLELIASEVSKPTYSKQHHSLFLQ
jgi:glycine hydroxymethyltransferase